MRKVYAEPAGQDDELAYSPERKAAVLAKMLPPNNMPLGRLAKEEGISAGTLAKWRAEARAKGRFLPEAKAGPEGWTSEDKLAAVIETASLNEAGLGEYCRRRGIYAEQLAVWREVCARANDWERAPSTTRAIWLPRRAWRRSIATGAIADDPSNLSQRGAFGSNQYNSSPKWAGLVHIF